MWDKIKNFFNGGSETGDIVAHVLLAVLMLAFAWIHPVIVFPAMMLLRELEQHDFNPFDMGWQSWKECLIPTAIFVPAYILLFG